MIGKGVVATIRGVGWAGPLYFSYSTFKEFCHAIVASICLCIGRSAPVGPRACWIAHSLQPIG
jgi:hypothetical protein